MSRTRRLAAAFASAVLLGVMPAMATAQVVISQIYTPGGGGGGSAGYANSYIELHNNGTTPASLAGWSVQYAAQGGGWEVTPLSGTIPVGGYYLVREGNSGGGGGSQPLPGFDATGNSFMTPAAGKVALVASMAQGNGCGNGLPLVDFVGYGSLGCFEGSAAAPAMGPTIANFRKLNGCQDTNDNANDFSLAPPVARWSGTAVAPCTAGPTGSAAATPALIPAGGSTRFTVTVTPGYNPASTGLTVTGNLSAIGGSASEPLYDDATHGDTTPGDNVFSLAYTVPLATQPAALAIAFTIADAQARSAPASAPLTVLAPVVVSQIYTPGGSGGNSQGYNHSYVELHNRGPWPASLSGWAVQYSAFSDTSWLATPLGGTIPPGGYYLVMEGNASPGGQTLPTPDATGTTWMYPSGGKVALVATNLTWSNCPPAGLPLVDLVGYGQTQCWEGSGPAFSISPMIALFRKSAGCQDTNDNAGDLATGLAAARNSASPAVACGATPLSALAAATPGVVRTGGATSFSVTVTPGGSPASTGITVTGDLSTIGGPASQPLYDDATHGDVTAGDNVFSLAYTTPANAAPGSYAVPFTAADAQARNANANGALQIVPPVVISQIFTPGGSGGSPRTTNHSYIELFNRGSVTASLAGWTVQYSGFADTAWVATPLTGSIPPGGYYLVQEDNPAPNGQPMPTPDVIGTIWMYPAGGKVALVASGDLATQCGAGGLPVLDLVGYGSTQCWEGSGHAPNMAPFVANFRRDQGCQDTNDNAADFFTGSVAPRNSASPVVNCAAPAPAAVAGTSQTAVGAGAPLQLTNTIAPGQNAIAPGQEAVASAYSVTADLAVFNMGVVAMVDDGTGGDEVAGDNVYTCVITVPGVGAGDYAVPMSACDAQSRCGTSTATVHVVSPTGVGDAPALEFALNGAAPNPAAGAFAIRFVLPTAEAARLSLVDVAGRRVESVDVGALGAGRHVVRFGDRARLAPGVYLARLTQGGRTATARVIVR